MVRKPSVGEGKIPDEPTGRPYPSAAQAGPEGLRCNRRCVGVGKSFVTNPRGVPIPAQPGQDRRDSGVTAAVWGKEKYLTNPRGVPIPPRPRLDRRDSGVTADVWGKEKYLTNPRGVPIPPRPRLDRRDSGVTAAVWG